jgi:Icc-related predicted phosphoesterase
VNADVTLLAGDIHTKKRVFSAGNLREAFGRPVVMIAGNHEFYGSSVQSTLEYLESGADHGVVFLENRQMVVASVRILGCTLWSDFRLFAGDDLDAVRSDANLCVGTRYGPGMNDFTKIRIASDGYRKLRPLDAALMHQASVAWLTTSLREGFDGPTVVMTHHAPSMLCVPPESRHDHMMAAFASRLDGLIEEFQPDLWVSGHIHASQPEFRIGRTRMISNPRGYVPADLNPRFDPGLVVSLG